MEMNKELLEKAKDIKSVEELIALAKEMGVELTEEAAAAYLAKNGAELSSEELEDVSAGAGNLPAHFDGKGEITPRAGKITY